jgi:hypothetical protein
MHDQTNVITLRSAAKTRVPQPAVDPSAASQVVEFSLAKRRKNVSAQLDAHAVKLVHEQIDARRQAWRKATAAFRLAEASLEWRDALCVAQRNELPDALALKRMEFFDPERQEAANLMSGALGAVLLTPAPDMAAVEWKRKAIRRRMVDLSVEQLDKSIEADLDWLAKNPAKLRRTRRQAD